MDPSMKDHNIKEEQPPTYSEVDQPLSIIPPLDLSQNAGLSIDTTVTQDECVVHLKFLATLADLRETVASTKGLFGIPDPIPELLGQSLNEALAKVKEKRWAVYTSRAAERYAAWWKACVPSSRSPVRLSDFERETYSNITDGDIPLPWSRHKLPPLDVLMVWHAHMLNPRAFLEDCIRHGKMSLWTAGFPWRLIHECTDDHNLVYEPGETARGNFYRRTSLQWDNLQDGLEKLLKCPRCEDPVSVPWTEGVASILPGETWQVCHGFADKKFAATCPTCEFIIDHEKLKVDKFRKDVIALAHSKLPMPGTFYNLRGVPEACTDLQRRKTQSSLPNRLLQAIYEDVMDFTDAKAGKCPSVTALRDLLESKLKDRKVMRVVNSASVGTTLYPVEKIAFRRMMSRYWDNVGPFALDLVGAVIRQGTFIQKMDDIDWLHSPTVKETMLRLIQKYAVFFSIMATNPRRMAVPTLDVDLAWHTHQLTPYRYYTYSTYMSFMGSRFPIFIDHDDKVAEDALSDGFEWTSKMYKKITNGELYSECTCWYCEAIRASDLYSRLSISSSTAKARSAADDLHNRPDISSDPSKNPHISAHNAVHPTEDSKRDARRMKFLQLQSNYEKARRRAEKRSGNKKGGDRRDANDPGLYAYPLVWGYPVAVPYYGPYTCDPGVNADTYPCNPACMNLAVGGHGNCAAGTCGGAVAAGGCGGLAGSGGCASGGGGAGGGCGGSSGGGGCGGGGGGGGGCGGGGGGGC
ncbi:hypothetical protein BJX96DRAFT_166243 [Aspergillus floccosus]